MGVFARPGSNTKESTTAERPEVGELQTVRVPGGKQVPPLLFSSLSVSQSGSHPASSSIFHR